MLHDLAYSHCRYDYSSLPELRDFTWFEYLCCFHSFRFFASLKRSIDCAYLLSSAFAFSFFSFHTLNSSLSQWALHAGYRSVQPLQGQLLFLVLFHDIVSYPTFQGCMGTGTDDGNHQAEALRIKPCTDCTLHILRHRECSYCTSPLHSPQVL